uniref:ARAD1B10296p n=1 Tax=Blastobotrys adeninivorans TaxID=409370 RepID=A0A060T5U5_BLAAD
MLGKFLGKKEYLGLRGVWLHRGVASIAGCGFLLFGYDQGVMGGLLTLDTFLETFPDMTTETLHQSIIQGTCVAIYEIGCMMGALSTLYFGDKYGRRKMIFSGSIIMTVGAILQCAAYHLGQLVVGRVVTGIGNGLITATVPMWQSECAKPEMRGLLVMIEGALITCGIMISYWVDYGMSFVTSDANWRFPLAFQIVFAIIIITFVLDLPESPRWLIKKSRIEEARAVFAALDDHPLDSPTIQYQIDEIIDSLTEETATKAALGKLFTYGKERHFHRLNLAFWNQCFQQISGINLITYYAATIYQDSLGMTGRLPLLLAACNGTEYFLASWIPFWTIERIGRRKLMLFGAAGQSATMAILTATVWDGVNRVPKNSASGVAAAVFLFVFNTFFAIGWLGMTWLYPAEIVSLEIRAPANGISTASNWIFNFLVVMITPIAFHNIKYYTYTIFAVINALIFVATYIFFPETKGRSLEEMDKIFEQSNPKTPWDVVKIADTMPRMRAISDEEAAEKHKQWLATHGKGPAVDHDEGTPAANIVETEKGAVEAHSNSRSPSQSD